MAWIAPSTRSTGDLISASIWNQDVSANPIALRAGDIVFPEGAWTPVIGGSGGTSGQTYTTQNGRYIKKGKDVTVEGYVVMNNIGTITGALQLQGLPFTSRNQSLLYGGLHIEHFSLLVAWAYISAEIQPNTTTATFYGTKVAIVSMIGMATADVQTGATFSISGSYIADA